MPRIRQRSCRKGRPAASLSIVVGLVLAMGLLTSGHSFAQAVDDKEHGRPPGVPIPIRRQSSSSRSTSGRFSRLGVMAATDRPSKKVVCGSMRGRPFWPAAQPVRPSFPETQG